jgi:dihydrolipoamide dehydrogenase
VSDLECDVAVIGAGTAGLAAERQAREAGARTLLIDEAYIGTTCAAVGCMPSKLLIAAADAASSIEHAAGFGIQGTATIDGPAVFRRLRKERDRFVAGVKRSIEDIPQEIRLTARASFIAPGKLKLDDGRTVTARSIVIATGAKPSVPEAFDAVSDLILTNESIFELADLPSSVAVIGAGSLGLEMAQALNRLGVRVEVFDMGDMLAGLRDRKVSDRLHQLLSREMDIHPGVEPQVGRDGDCVRVSWEDRRGQFDRLLVAAGRPPNLAGLDLDEANIPLDDRGVPDIDTETLQCGDSGVFVAGDANAVRPLLHEAAHEGRIAGRNAAHFPDVSRYERSVPMAITFTRPENGTVGAVPQDDDDAHVTGEASFDDQGRARVEARTGGLCRIYARRSDARLVGASLCAPEAGHLAHLLALAIEAKMTAADVLRLPFYHPTLEEGLKPAFRSLCHDLEQPADTSRAEDSPCA